MAWADPILIDDLEKPNRITPLTRQKPGHANGNVGYHEILLQRLIHTSPTCLPIKEIDSAFVELRPVCMELPLASESKERFADNLLINAAGRICLVECKLASNPEADRDVLAQLIDYAAVLSRLDYNGLRDRVCQALGKQGDPIVDSVLGTGANPDQVADLVAGIEHSLRRGQLLLLIVGDRIRSHTERLVELLRERVNLGFTFGLIEMPIFGAADAPGYIVQPRVVAKTTIIERTVFVASGPGNELSIQKVEQKKGAANLSEQDFYAGLSRVDESYPERVRSFIAKARDLGCEAQLLRKYNIYVDDGLGSLLNVLSISPSGRFEVWGVAGRDARLDAPAGREYMARVAAMLPGGSLKDDNPSPASWNIRVGGKIAIDLSHLLVREEEWLEAILALRDRLVELQRKREAQQG
jgi:hypothetical protein